MNHNKLLFILILIIQFSCISNKNNENIEKIHFDKENLMNITNKKYIKLETNKNCLIGDINQFEIINNYLFILDAFSSKKLYVFDLEGNYITHIGIQGNGPNEYIFPLSFSINNSSISILDDHQLAILTYDINSFNFVRKHNIPYSINDFETLSENNFIVYNYRSLTPPQKAYHFYITDSLFQIKSKHITSEFESGHIYPPFKNMYKLNGKIYGFIRFKNYIYEVTSETAIPKYEFTVEQYKFPTIDFLKSEENTSFNGNYMPGLEKSKYISSYNISENNTSLCINYTANKKGHIGIYDKQNRKSYNYSISRFQENFKIPGIDKMVGRSESSIAFMLRPYMISNQIDDGAECDNELKELIKDSTPEDNPIIFLFNI